MLHTHILTIPPTPISDTMGGHFRVVFDHGVEMVINVVLVRMPDDPDHLSGTIELRTEARVQDVVRESPTTPSFRPTP